MPSNLISPVATKTYPSYTPAEMRARSILSRMESLSAKLKTLEADIRLLWLDFENLKAGETILGCSTKAEFCEKKLNRTPRAIQYMLAGGNTNRALLPPASETFSLPPAPEPDAEPEPDVESTETPEPPSPESDIEGAVLTLPDAPELDAAVKHPPEISAAKKSQPAKTDAKVGSRLKKVQREWASVANPDIGRITVTSSNVGSGVETSLGRYDLLLSGVRKPMLDTIREVLPHLNKPILDRLRKLLS